MASQQFPVAYFFHSGDNLSKRKKVFDKYAKKFKIQLFMFEEDQNMPRINYLGGSEEEYKKADGLFIGDHL